MKYPSTKKLKHIMMHSLLLRCILFFLLSFTKAETKVPAIYVFGDSTVDVGNNNYLPASTVAKVNFLPYGVDFLYSRPTGRFSNGYNTADFFAMYAGFERSPPAYLSITQNTTDQITKGLQGVNYASGGTGILDSTASTAITMTQQLQYFNSTKLAITAGLGSKISDDLISKSLFVISTGGNDLFAFVLQNASSPNNTQVTTFVTGLMSKYASHITVLYGMGARKFGIVGVGPIGCCPFVRAQNPTGDCVKSMNDLANGVNDAIRSFLKDLSPKLQGMKYSVGSSYKAVTDIISNPSANGFKEAQSACCGSGIFNGGACLPNSTYCDDRNAYAFWDRIHRTQAVSKKETFNIYYGSLEFASPINFKQLVEAY